MTCSIHGDCPYCKALAALGDPRVSVEINVTQLPLKCPLCDGAKEISGATCPMCKGSGKRPTDAELAARRVPDPTPDNSLEKP